MPNNHDVKKVNEKDKFKELLNQTKSKNEISLIVDANNNNNNENKPSIKKRIILKAEGD